MSLNRPGAASGILSLIQKRLTATARNIDAHPIYGTLIQQQQQHHRHLCFQRGRSLLPLLQQQHHHQFIKASAPASRQTRSRRFYADKQAVRHQEMPTEYQAVVLGAGPAGIAVVGNLLAERVRPILWIDDKFEGGRLNEKYREVPSNTRVCLFRDFATAISPLKKIVEETPAPNAFTVLEDMDGESRCTIAEAADLCKMLVDGLGPEAGVHKLLGTAEQFEWIETSKQWVVKATKSGQTCTSEKDESTATAKMLVLCHGSSPSSNVSIKHLKQIETDAMTCLSQHPDNEKHIKLANHTRKAPLRHDLAELKEINLDSALKPSELSNLISKSQAVQIGVIGASHSAVLVLRNLFNLCITTHPHLSVRWFTRHPLRYAIPQPSGWTLRDNTGLKGVAATFAKEYLEDDKLPCSRAAKYFVKVATTRENEEQMYVKELQACTYMIQATGYTQDPFPPLKVDGKVLDPEVLRKEYDNQSGRLRNAQGEVIPGAYGAGIAWPEKTTDPEGNVECSVGMWKFMRYLREVVPGWVESSIKGKV